MHFHFAALTTELADAWKQVFAGVDQVTVHHQSIFDLQCDAIVSPANSFGYMNGGIDFTISKTMGWHIEKTLQQRIREHFHGELLVGQATVVKTEHEQFPFLIAAPTMRTPMSIFRSPNIYLAMKALLILVKDGKFDDGTPVADRIQTIAVPGLGTGIGQVPPLMCARQMRIAWEDVMNEHHTSEKTWEALQSNYAYFYTHEERDLKYDIP